LPKKPTVYLTFERSGRVGEEKEERVFFRFRNNTRWGLRLDMGGELKGYGDARLFYEILSAYNVIGKSVSCHVCSTNILGPGRTLLFSVPKEDVSNSYAIRIQYSYAWEDDLDSDEPTHFVSFVLRYLPENLHPKKSESTILF
jgi:hypothetical protein